jgi:pimeloyl-ACP methyl ester carboxylesterase
MRNTASGLAVIAVLLAGSAGSGAPAPRHLIYLHGRIVQEQQSVRPRHPQYGHYELEAILEAFRTRGFVVRGEIRPKAVSVSEAADRVVEQARELLKGGVPAHHVTIVGASMGASIGLLASVRLQNPDVRFGVLGACLSENVRGLVADEGMAPKGHVLAIREASDELSTPCPSWKNDAQSWPGLDGREIVIHTGLSHGFLYRPLADWVNPVAEWAGATK